MKRAASLFASTIWVFLGSLLRCIHASLVVEFPVPCPFCHTFLIFSIRAFLYVISMHYHHRSHSHTLIITFSIHRRWQASIASIDHRPSTSGCHRRYGISTDQCKCDFIIVFLRSISVLGLAWPHLVSVARTPVASSSRSTTRFRAACARRSTD